MKGFNFILYVVLWRKATGFLSSDSRPSFLGTHGAVKESSRVTTVETELSDTDTRVLESMLQETKLDLETEADIRKLLERGTVKKVSAPQKREKEVAESDFYSSTILKTLGDTKLWKKLSTQASDVFESVGIWIGNKVEQDVKTLAALGFFAWERAVRDVGRALPQAGDLSKNTMFLITNSSSAASNSANQINIKDRMLRPQDEIQAVSREIRGILSGQQRTSSGRNLRTIAPAGSSNNAERLRRAYQQSKKAENQAKDLTKVPGKVVDGAWELRRELRSETNEPGYKSKPIRDAIAAGVVNTGNLLQSVKEQAKLAASRRKEERLLGSQTALLRDDISLPSAASRIEDRVRPAPVESVLFDNNRSQESTDPYEAASMEFDKASNRDVLSLLRGERRRVLKQLALCVDDPSKSWLNGFSGDPSLGKDALITVVTTMVLLRNDIEEREVFDDETSAEVVLIHLHEIKAAMDDILQVAETSLSPSIVRSLETEVYGFDPAHEKTPLILRLEGIESPDDLLISLRREFEFKNDPYPATHEFVESHRSAHSYEDIEPRTVQVTLKIIDAVTESSIKTPYQPTEFRDEDITEQYEQYVMTNAEVEVVVDDAIFEAADRAKKRVEVAEEKQQENEVMRLALRSLDIVFFVVEKTLFAAIPHAVAISTTVFQRAMAVNELGRGSCGWEQFSKLGNSKAKY